MKRIALIVIAVLILSISALLAAPFFIPKKTYLGYITKAVEQSAPVHLELEDASLTLFPHPSIRLKNVALQILKDGVPSPFFELASLKATSDWWPLLSKRFVLNLSAEKGAVHLAEEAEGRWNYQRLVKPDQKKEPSTALQGWAFQTHGIDLRESRLLMRDRDGKESDITVKRFLLNRLEYENKEKPKIHAAGSITDAEIKAKDRTVSAIKARFDYQDNRFQLKDFSARILDGTADGDVTLVLSEKPTYTFDLNLKDIALDQASNGLVSGRGSASIKGKGEGFEQEQWNRTLDATGRLSASGVRSEKIDAFKALFRHPVWSALKAIPGVINQEAIDKIENLDTQLDKIETSFTIEKGVLRLDNLRAPLPDSFLALSGGIGLDKHVDFSGDLSLQKPLVDSLLQNDRLKSYVVDQNQALVIPLKISGEASHPAVTLDVTILQTAVQKFASDRAQEEIKKAVKPIEDQIRKQIPEKIPIKIPKLPF